MKLKEINLTKSTKKRMIIATIGAIIIAFGVGMLIASDLGADSINVLYDALHKKFGLTIGRWTFIGGSIMLVFTLITNKKRIGYTTVIFVLISQFCIDFVNTNINPNTFMSKLIIAIIGLLVTGVGCGISLDAGLGLSIYDAFTYCVNDIVKGKYTIVRYAIDGTLLLIGWLLGGTVGIGTIMCLVYFGPAIPLFANLLKQPIEKFLNN